MQVYFENIFETKKKIFDKIKYKDFLNFFIPTYQKKNAYF